MPWCWRPLWGPYWVEEQLPEKEIKQNDKNKTTCCISSGKINPVEVSAVTSICREKSIEAENISKGSENREQAVEKPVEGENKRRELHDLVNNSINKKFEEIKPGVFCFKNHGGEKSGGQILDVLPRAGIPASLDYYRKIAITKDGLPIYTFD